MEAVKKFALVELDLKEPERVVDENLDLSDFYVLNDIEPDAVNAIGKLDVGQEHQMGGGAGAWFAVRRLA